MNKEPAAVENMIRISAPGDRFWTLADDATTYDLVGLGMDLDNRVRVGHFAVRR